MKYLIQPGLTGPQTPVPIGHCHNWVHFAQDVFHLQEVPAVPRQELLPVVNAFKLLRVRFNEALVILSLGCLLQGVNKTVPGEKEK